MDCVTALENALKTITVTTTTMFAFSTFFTTDPIKQQLFDFVQTTTTMFTISMTVITVDSIKDQAFDLATLTTKSLFMKNGCIKIINILNQDN